jgi:hypothetical protein
MPVLATLLQLIPIVIGLVFLWAAIRAVGHLNRIEQLLWGIRERLPKPPPLVKKGSEP